MSRRLLLIDDHPLFVDGFVAMLGQFRPGWSLCSATHVAGAAGMVAEADPIDLALVDIQLPDGDGFSAIDMLRRALPELPCIIISGREDIGARGRAAACGARAFIGKSDTPQSIIAIIDAVLDGSDLCAADPIAQAALPPLSPRQNEVLALLAEGHANKEIRYRLGIAERTVRAHLTELFSLLGVTSRVQAILKARQIGLID